MRVRQPTSSHRLRGGPASCVCTGESESWPEALRTRTDKSAEGGNSLGWSANILKALLKFERNEGERYLFEQKNTFC
jgi:hypothetical protein